MGGWNIAEQLSTRLQSLWRENVYKLAGDYGNHPPKFLRVSKKPKVQQMSHTLSVIAHRQTPVLHNSRDVWTLDPKYCNGNHTEVSPRGRVPRLGLSPEPVFILTVPLGTPPER